uniref:Uncharacterized protein n=1 Tax=Rhizophora mucronata TaxID=61149 RepID=A0A2P2PD76_RHIMU
MKSDAKNAYQLQLTNKYNKLVLSFQKVSIFV